ncbi:hypothetical protein [Fischerella sp. JS2]|uniref:hypothetical protein n=1 Tax=Fischerella sp. JS2 TaxID=2597771 RepID=UPI0028E6A914|nr:hypothetical protein [Fischerella sp. JS2]
MTITTTNPNLQVKKQIKKKRLSQYPINIGTPRVPLRQLPVKQEHELLSDWENAS